MLGNGSSPLKSNLEYYTTDRARECELSELFSCLVTPQIVCITGTGGPDNCVVGRVTELEWHRDVPGRIGVKIGNDWIPLDVSRTEVPSATISDPLVIAVGSGETIDINSIQEAFACRRSVAIPGSSFPKYSRPTIEAVMVDSDEELLKIRVEREWYPVVGAK